MALSVGYAIRRYAVYLTGVGAQVAGAAHHADWHVRAAAPDSIHPFTLHTVMQMLTSYRLAGTQAR